jgi:8-oxo-dGTP pyrophosphatase MutT (NUDIX family)
VATSPARREREGTVSLFGGGAKAEEDRAACLKREVREELPELLRFLPKEPAEWGNAPPVCDDDYPYTLTPLYCGEWSQAVYRKLAESCRDGYVLPVGLDGIDKFVFGTSKMRGNVYEELYELMVDVQVKAKG